MGWARVALTFLFATCLLARAVFAAAPVPGDAQIVEFESATFTCKPSAFRVRQAEKLGKPLEMRTQPSVAISGYLVRPDVRTPALQSSFCTAVQASLNTN